MREPQRGNRKSNYSKNSGPVLDRRQKLGDAWKRHHGPWPRDGGEGRIADQHRVSVKQYSEFTDASLIGSNDLSADVISVQKWSLGIDRDQRNSMPFVK